MKANEYKQAIQRRAEIKAEVAELQGTLAKENRAMSDVERQHMAELRAEDDGIALRCTQHELEQRDAQMRANEAKVNMKSSNRALVEVLRSMGQGRGIPSGYGYLRAQGNNARLLIPGSAEDLQMRADSDVQNTPSVEPVVPLTIHEVIKALEPQTIIGQLGLKIQNGIQGQWNYPTIGGGKAVWAGENEEVASAAVNIGKITPTPHRVATRVDISNLALWQSAGAVRQMILDRMSENVAQLVNSTMFSVTKVNANAPEGPFVNVPAANKIKAAGALTTVTRGNLIDLRTAVNGKANVPVLAPAYIVNWETYAALANTPIDKGSGRFVIDIATNTIDGVKVIASNYVPVGYIYYGDFGYEMLGQFNDMTLTVDGQSAAVAARNVTAAVINSEWDMVAAHAEAFGYVTYTTA